MKMKGNEIKLKSLIKFISTVFVVLFLALSLTIGFCADSYVSNGVNTISAANESITETFSILVEKINGELCKEGTYNQIILATGNIYGDAHNKAIAQINEYYDQMIVNTEDYLDWYYSFSGQWTQLGNLVKGIFRLSVEEEVSKMIQSKMEEYMTPDSDIMTNINGIYKSAKSKALSVANSIIEENRINIDGKGNVYVLLDTTFDDIISENSKRYDVNHAIIATTGIVTGITSGIIAKRVVSKVITKSVSKLAIKTSTKAAIGLIGKIAVPVIGTLVFTAVDIIGISVDEAVNRDAYRTEIINGINHERANLLSQIDSYFASIE